MAKRGATALDCAVSLAMTRSSVSHFYLNSPKRCVPLSKVVAAAQAEGPLYCTAT